MTFPEQLAASRFHLLAFLLLSISALLAYSNSFDAALTFDDHPNIVNNRAIHLDHLSLANLIEVADRSPMPFRPLPYLTFAINHAVHGLAAPGFHAVNLAIHLATGFMLYLLVLTTLNLPGLAAGAGSRPREIALAAALLWLLHPVQTNAVTYIVQRMTSLAALFSLITLFFYARGRLQTGHRRYLAWGAAAIAASLALLSKENSAMLPVLILGYELFFPRTIAWRRLAWPIGLAAAGLVLLAWLYLGNKPLDALLTGYARRDFTLSERLLTEPRVLVHYLTLLLLPLPSRLNLNHDFIVSHGLLAPPQTLLALLFLLGLVAALPLLYRRSRLLAFALFWFLANLAIESTIIPLELLFEHRLYLPSAFLFAAAAWCLARLTESRPGLFRAGVLGLAALLALGTWIRNNDWRTEISIWTDVIQKAPGLARGYANLGKAESDQGNMQAAIAHFKKAMAVEPHKGAAYYNLGISYDLQNRLPEALEILTLALDKKEVNPAQVHNELGIVHRKLGNFTRAIQEAHEALNLDPAQLESYITIGICYEKMGQPDRALALFQEAAAKGLDSEDLHNNWAISLTTLGRFDQAIGHLTRAVTLNPDHFESNYNLGLMYSRVGRLVEADRQISHALALKNREAGKAEAR